MSAQHGAIRLGIVDADSGFLKVLSKRLGAAGYEYRVLSGGVPPEELVAMKLNALLIDPSVLRSDPWDFLERVCNLLPGLGVVVCAANSTVAQRVRGLRIGADDWIAKPCHPEEVLARVEAVVRRHRRGQRHRRRRPARRRRARDPARPVPGLRRRASPSGSPGASTSCSTSWPRPRAA